MSATTKSARQKQASSKAAKPAPAAPKRARKKPEPAPEITAEEQRRAAISAGMRELTEARSKGRAKRDGVPVKHVIFNEWFKALLAGKSLDIAATAKKYPEVKESTIKSWVSGWKSGKVPSNGRGKEKQIAAALKKLAA